MLSVIQYLFDVNIQLVIFSTPVGLLGRVIGVIFWVYTFRRLEYVFVVTFQTFHYIMLCWYLLAGLGLVIDV